MDAATRQDLWDNFDAEFYMVRKGSAKYQQTINKFVSDWMFDLFSTGDVSGETLLDIGTGPNINSVIYAYPHFKNIYLSDFSRSAREFLQEWRDGNHSETVKHYFEGAIKREGSTHTALEKQEELRRKIADILYCDVTQSNPIGADPPTGPVQFDAVTTSWCIDSAVDTNEEYLNALRNVVSLIKPGGHLILMDAYVFKKSYEVNGVMYPCVTLNMERLKKIIENSYKEIFPHVEFMYREAAGDTCHAFNFAVKIPK